MKGLFKGLRMFSQIFDTKEEEMQIGYPTDVRHVAHIGWDGPSVNPPTWMNEFRSAPLSALGAEAMADHAPARFPSHDLNSDSPLREPADQPVPKPRRQASSGVAALDSPTQSPGVPRRSRRNRSANGLSDDTPTRAANGGGDGSAVSTPTESPARDLPSIPKVARKKKTKAGAGGSGGSSRAGRSKGYPSLSEGGEGAERSGENLPAIASPGPGEGT